MSNKDVPENVETIVGRTNTWACNLIIGSVLLAWGYFLYAVIIANFEWLVAMAIIVSLSLVIYRFPVVLLIEPLSKAQLESYLGNASRTDWE